MARVLRPAFVCAWVLLLPGLVSAQATVSGTVRDPSGALLPGVTVEASSPSLIEKVRTAATDGTGQYRITDLPPGDYVLAFSLGGFATVRRDGVSLSGTGVIPINADLRVGALQETIRENPQQTHRTGGPGAGGLRRHAHLDARRELARRGPGGSADRFRRVVHRGTRPGEIPHARRRGFGVEFVFESARTRNRSAGYRAAASSSPGSSTARIP